MKASRISHGLLNYSLYSLLGSLGGLHLVLNAEQYDYVYDGIGFGSEAGFFISIHDPEIPEMEPVANAYFAPVGFATRISMQKEKVGISPV